MHVVANTSLPLHHKTCRKDYDHARLLYTDALRTTEERGPNVQLLLFAFAIFCLVTRVRVVFRECRRIFLGVFATLPSLANHSVHTS